MRPLRLQLSGFTCFREETLVNFDELELFAIEGPTGSGKSTILDALTYTLYGQTPRLGGRGLDALLSPGLEQMLASLEFEVGSHAYRATRTLVKKASRVEPQVRVERLSGGDWKQLPETEKIKEAGAALERIVGLDYDSFTRAVMLPQGAFDSFLRGDASKRRRLLVNLLGLDRLEKMQKEAGQRARDAEREQKGIELRLEQDYQGATPDKLRTLKNERTSLQTERERLMTLRKEAQTELAGLEEVKALLDTRQEVVRKLAGLEARADQIEADKEALERAKRAALLTPQLETLAAQEVKLKRVLGEVKTLKGALDARRQEVERAETSLEAAEKEAARLPEIQTQLGELKAAEPLLKQLRARKGTLKLAERETAQPYSDGIWDEAWDTLQSKRAQVPSLQRAVQREREAAKSLEAAQKAVETTGQEIEGLKRRLESLKAEGTAAKEVAEKTSKTHEQAVVENQALALRPHLHEGDACPVCEQEIKQLPEPREDEVDLAALAKAKEKAQEKLEQLRDAYTTTYTNLKNARETRLKERQGEVERSERQLQEAQKERLELANLFTDEPEGLELDTLIKDLEIQRLDLLAGLAQEVVEKSNGLDPERAPAQLAAEAKQIETNLKRAQEAQVRAKAELDKLMSKAESLAERQKELAEEVAGTKEKLEQSLKGADFGSAEEVRQSALSDAEQRRLADAIQTFTSQRATLEQRQKELEGQLKGRTLDEAVYKTLKTQLSESEEGLNEVQQRLGSVAKELEHVEGQLERASHLRKELTRLGRDYDTYRQLHGDLRGNQFQDYLMTRVQSDLAIRASQILRDATEGRYDLRLKDSEYHVLDAWHTGELRNVKTLSGGETFIASLALALALSDSVAGNATLGALFLDEGFGTLDLETLDSVAKVLEALTEQGRMVGVVTHVTALSERLPSRLKVRKKPEGSVVYWD